MPKTKLFSSDNSGAKQFFIWVSVCLALLLSLLDLAGWIFNIAVLRSLTPKLGAMNLITAICFILTVATLLIILLDFPSVKIKSLSVFLATIICGVSLISVYACIYYIETGRESSITSYQLLACSFLLKKEWHFLLPAIFFLQESYFY